jgi:hypothetical protein
MPNLPEQILQNVGTLPTEDQQQVLDFIESLRLKRQKHTTLTQPSTQSFFEVAQGAIGAGEGLGDLSTNPEYLRGYGE